MFLLLVDVHSYDMICIQCITLDESITKYAIIYNVHTRTDVTNVTESFPKMECYLFNALHLTSQYAIIYIPGPMTI